MNTPKNYTFTWWQIGLFKLALLSLGIAIGSYYQETFLPYFIGLISFGIIIGGYIAFVLFRKK